MDKQTKKNRILILAMAGAFILPLLISAILVNTTSDWMSWSRKNTGTLIHPAQPLTEFTLQNVKDNANFNLEGLQHKWNVVFIGGATCDEVCKDILYKTRQSRLAKGKEMERIRRIYVVNDGLALSQEMQDFLAQEHPDMVVLSGDANSLKAFAAQFQPDGKSNSGRVYLVDPLGNLMMYYEADFPAKGLIKDLGRLLYVSQIG